MLNTLVWWHLISVELVKVLQHVRIGGMARYDQTWITSILIMWPHTMCSHVYQSMSNGSKLKLHEIIHMLTSQGGASMATLHSWLNTDRQNLTGFFSRFSSEILFYTYLHTIYIKFIKYIQNNGELRCFELIWFLY